MKACRCKASAAHREALKQPCRRQSRSWRPSASSSSTRSPSPFPFPPSAVLKVIGGFLFGWLAGALYIVVAATIGGTALFLARADRLRRFPERPGGHKRQRDSQREFERMHSPICWRCGSRHSSLSSWSASRRRSSTCGSATYPRRDPARRTAGSFLLRLAGTRARTACWWTPEASGREIALSDLVTPEITIALLALTLVAVLATIVRKVRGPQVS